MSGREWVPGQVAMVSTSNESSGRAVRRGGVWMFLDREGYAIDPYVDDARPLVVLDPENREQVERLGRDFHESDHIAPWHDLHSESREQICDAMQAALREFANPKPPKPEEPTDPSVRVTDRRENTWRLLADGDWICVYGLDSGEYLNWDRLADERGPVTVEVDG